jgi:glycosyltransferase involved in cell wall biosynthesis
MDISIIIPLLNEEASLNELHQWISKVMKSNGYSYELIFIDDGSKDLSWSIITKLASENTEVNGIRFLEILVNRKPYTQVSQKQKEM